MDGLRRRGREDEPLIDRPAKPSSSGGGGGGGGGVIGGVILIGLLVTGAVVLSIVAVVTVLSHKTSFAADIIMTHQVMFTETLAHNASGVIPPTHARQTLQSSTISGPVPIIEHTASLPLGNITVGTLITSPNGTLGFKARAGTWFVRDLVTGDPYTSASDVGGTRVIQGGIANSYGGQSDCGSDNASPKDNDKIALSIFSLSPSSSLVTINIRSGSEAGYDYVSVRRNDLVLYRVSGAGPSATDAYLEQTITIPMSGNDVIFVEFEKDGSCWGGYDSVYLYVSSVSSTAISTTLPSDLTPYVGKDITVCSLDNVGHTITSELAHFDSNAYWKTLTFNGNGQDTCCASFSVTSASQIHVKAYDTCILFCNDADRLHCVDPLRPGKTNRIHGEWRAIDKNGDYAYARVDASTNPISARFYGGTVTTPLEEYQVFSFYPVGFRTYKTDSDPNLINGTGFPDALTLIADVEQFFYYHGFTNQISEYVGGFEKVSEIPPLLPTGSGSLAGSLPPDHPEAIFRNLVDRFIYNSHVGLDVTLADEKWIGVWAALELADKIVKEGTGPVTAPIIEARVTQLGNPEGITEFRFADYHHIAPPAIVTISGYDLTGTCASLNGEHMMNVATTNNIPLPSPLYEDYGPNASARTVHHKLGVFLDSSAVPVFPGTSVANCNGTNNPVATVSYGPLKGDTNHIRTVGAVYYWFYEAMKVGQHFGPLMIFDESTSTPRSGMAYPRVDWNDVAADVLYGLSSVSEKLVRSRHYDTATDIYVNGASGIGGERYGDLLNAAGSTADARLWSSACDFTGRFGIRPDRESSIVVFQTDNARRSTHWIHIPIQNYLEEVAYPAWKMVGTSRSGEFNLVAQASYPGGEGDTFDTVMVPHGTLPPANYSYLIFDAPLNFDNAYANLYDFQNQGLQEQFFVGRVRTNLTSGIGNIGYIRISAEHYFDPGFLGWSSELCPLTHCENNRDGLTRAFAEVSRYLIGTLGCEHVIIDSRSNGGGYTSTIYALRDLFGTDAGGWEFQWLEHPGTGYGPSIDLATIPFANDFYIQQRKERDYAPLITEANIPGSVFTNAQVVFMTDTSSASGGDLLPGAFLGNAFDGQLGGNTQVSMVGSIDGRLAGASVIYDMPKSASAPRLRTADGTAAPPLRCRIDGGRGQTRRADATSFANRHLGLEIDYTGATGLAGGNALWGDWDELVYKDLGYVANNRPILSGWSHPQSPYNVEVTNAIATSSGSNVVTVTTPGAHGFSTGDEVALGSTALPVSACAGIASRVLTGAQIITVTSPTTFTFETADANLYPGYDSPVANSTVTACGGTFRVMNRNHWRDAWLEQSIKTIVSQAKKRNHVAKSPAEKRERKQRADAHATREKQARATAKFNLRLANERFGRNVACPDASVLTHPSAMAASVNITVYKELHTTDEEYRTEVQKANAELIAILKSELAEGGMCLDADGRLMATPTCKQNPRIKYAQRRQTSPRSGVTSAKKQNVKMVQRQMRAVKYSTCINACNVDDDKKKNVRRKCELACGNQYED